MVKFGDTGTVNKLTGSSGARNFRAEENVYLVNDLVLSQEDMLRKICHRLTERSVKF